MRREFKLEGIFPALITPFGKGKELNEDALRELVGSILPEVDGFVPCGTTGEFEYLSKKERKRVYEVVIDETNGRGWVIAGTGASSTREVIELTKYAEDVGADAVLVVKPYFLSPSDKGIYEHYWQLSRATDLPIVMYNIPQTAGAYIPRKVIEDLAKLDNIFGLKDSSGNLAYVLEVLEKVGEKIKVVVGHDEIVLPALAAGCSGMILASAQVYPELWRKVYNSVKKEDLKSARKVQFAVQKLSRIFCRYGGPVPIKAALRMMGLQVGRARAPLREGGDILPEDREEIRLELKKLGKVKPEKLEVERFEKGFEDLGIKEGLFGSGEAGEGAEKTRVVLVLGEKNGAIGRAFARQFTYPKKGFEALPAMLEPNLSVKPATLLLPAVEVKNLRQANLIYGPAQSAIAKSIVDKVKEGSLREFVEDYVAISRVFIYPSALDRRVLYENIYQATCKAWEDALQSEYL